MHWKGHILLHGMFLPVRSCLHGIIVPRGFEKGKLILIIFLLFWNLLVCMKKRSWLPFGAASLVMACAVYLVLNYHPDNVRYTAAMRKIDVNSEVQQTGIDSRVTSAKELNTNGNGVLLPQPPEPPPLNIPMSVIKCDGASKHRSSREIALSSDTVSLFFVGDISFGKRHTIMLRPITRYAPAGWSGRLEHY